MQMKTTVLGIARLVVAAIIGVTLYPSVTHLPSFTVSVDAKESQVLPHLTLDQSTIATSVYDGHEFAQGVTESVSKETNVKFVNELLIQKEKKKLKLKEVHMQNYSQLALEQSTRATSVYDRRQFVTESVTKEPNVKFVNELLIQKEKKKLKLKEAHMQNYSQLFHKANRLHSLKEKLQILPITCFPGSEGLFPKKYTKFLLALAEYATFHSNASNVRKLIWKCGPGGICGGLGDRLRGIAFTLLLAVLSRRKLLLYWGMPNGEQIYLKPNIINWIPEKSDVSNLTVYSVMHSAGAELDRAVKAIGQNNLMKVSLHTNLELELINNQTNKPQWLIDGLKQTGLNTLTNKEINQLFGIAIRYLFVFRDDVIPKVNDAKHSMGVDGQKYVAIHVRTGFVGSNLVQSERARKCIRKKKQWEQMLNCGVSVANSNLGQNSSIFLATDSKLVKDLAAKMYGSRFKTLDVVLTHVDCVDKELGPKREGLMSAWVDFILLAQSYAQVRAGGDWVSGSGFDLGSSHLCGLPSNRRFNGRKNCTSDDKL